MTPTLMAIFAHPDDEAFSSAGTLAHHARQGHKVLLVCATRGEAGKVAGGGSSEDLGQQREAELRAACQAMGIEPPIFLDYHDSGRFERTRKDDPKAMMNVDAGELEARLRELIAKHTPQVLLTFDPHGAYGHPDHLKIHVAATAAFHSTSHLTRPPLRLFYTAISHQAAGMLDAMNPGTEMDPTLYGVSEASFIVVQQLSADDLARKEAALQAHASQTGPGSVFARLGQEQPELLREWMSQETFSLGGSRTALTYPLPGFFSGLEQ